jgi:hypothetical protein
MPGAVLPFNETIGETIPPNTAHVRDSLFPFRDFTYTNLFHPGCQRFATNMAVERRLRRRGEVGSRQDAMWLSKVYLSTTFLQIGLTSLQILYPQIH